jgi:cardiolipin synthase A/B
MCGEALFLMIATLLFLADFILRVLLILRVVLSRRPVPVILSWVILLVIPVPWIGVIAYLIVGEPRLGTRRVRRYNELTQGFLEKAALLWKAQTHDWDPECKPYSHIAAVASLVGGIPPVRGNTVTFLGGWQPTVERLVQDIDAAQRSCHLSFFIWQESGVGLEVVAAVERAARRGVGCRVLVDAVGSKKFLRSRLPARLRAAGADVVAALPVNPLRMLLSRVDLRNHRKIVVIDGHIAYTGSQNITDDSFKFNPIRKIGPWIDSTVRVQGPAATALDVIFLRDWYSEVGENIDGIIHELLPATSDIAEGGCTVHVVPSGPGAGMFPMREAMLTAIYSAREELIITTPYFVPDDALKAAFVTAALAGVDVTLVVPKHSDAPTTAAAGESMFGELLEAGVKIKRFKNGLLHSKTITVDSDVAIIGSANLDTRSFYLNFEVTLFVYDPDEASLLRMLQVSYMEASEDLFLEDWNNRSPLRKLGQHMAKLLGPLL